MLALEVASLAPDRTQTAKATNSAICRRNDSESLNRSLEHTLFLGRAHSLGWRRQQVETLGWAADGQGPHEGPLQTG